MKRHTEEWQPWELDLLERLYALEGTAFIRARTGRSENSIRQKATRLNLHEDMLEFTSAADVAREAGVDTNNVTRWIDAHGYTRHCRTHGRDLLLPAPAARAYLDTRIPRRSARPAGWWGVDRTAAYLAISPARVGAYATRGDITAVRVRKTVYYDPHSVRAFHTDRLQARPRPNEVSVRALANLTGLNQSRDLRTLPKVTRTPTGSRPAHYTPIDAARALLTERGHHAEQVDTLLRRALAMQLSGVKAP